MAGHHPPHRHSDKESLVTDDSVLGEMGMLFEGLYPTTTKGFLWESPFGGVGRSNLEAAAVVPSPIASTLASRKTETEAIEWEHRPRPIQSFVVVEENPSIVDLRRYKSQQKQAARETEALGSVIGAVVRCIDDDPGALVSGHYVWPASLALCDFLVAEAHAGCCRRMLLGWKPPHKRTIDTNTSSSSCSGQTTTNNKNSIDDSQGNAMVRSVLELGAGSGIPSILASQIFGDTLHRVVVTDGDPTALERARENHQRTLTEIETGTGRLGASARKDVADSGIASSAMLPVRTEFHRLTWGSKSDWQALTEALERDNEAENSPSKFQSTQDEEDEEQQYWPNSKQAPDRCLFFDLVLGSDLIDCVQVVEPLFATVDRALKTKETIPESLSQHPTTSSSRFLLAQSFLYDSETEAAIERACHRFALERRLWMPAAPAVVPELQHDGDPHPPMRGRNPGATTNNDNITRIQEFQRRCES